MNIYMLNWGKGTSQDLAHAKVTLLPDRVLAQTAQPSHGTSVGVSLPVM